MVTPSEDRGQTTEDSRLRPSDPFDHAPRDSARDRQGRLCSGLRRAKEGGSSRFQVPSSKFKVRTRYRLSFSV